MDSWQPTAAPPHPHTPTTPKRPDCCWAPTRGYPSLLLWYSRRFRLYGAQLIVYLPMNPSVYVPLIRGPFPCSTQLFFLSSFPSVALPSQPNVALFLSSRSLALSLSLLYTLYLGTHEYTERRQMSQIHHLRDAVVMEKSQGTYEWGR